MPYRCMKTFCVQNSKYRSISLNPWYWRKLNFCYCTVNDFVHHFGLLIYTERCASLIVLACNIATMEWWHIATQEIVLSPDRGGHVLQQLSYLVD